MEQQLNLHWRIWPSLLSVSNAKVWGEGVMGFSSFSEFWLLRLLTEASVILEPACRKGELQEKGQGIFFITDGFLLWWRRQWHPTPGLLPGKAHGRRSLVGCCPWGREESDMTEWLHFHFSLLCIGEGNGNPLQCSCLENPRDGVAQSWSRLKWLSSSSLRCLQCLKLISLTGAFWAH